MIISAVEYSAQQPLGFVEDLKTIRNVGLRHGEGPSDCDNSVVRYRSVLKSKNWWSSGWIKMYRLVWVTGVFDYIN